ncbi:winged helix-turn-helix transcriptional regulator [bacterium]|nr:MAG: winged helix-turn-helix transcriptional regulator [bacterium]
MNNKGEQTRHPDDYRSLLLLDEISKGTELTQRDLSKKLGVALGLINSYVKNLISKGYVTVSTIPKKRFKYYLTPSGFTEKTRLTYQHLQNFTNLYKVARRDFNSLFNSIQSSNIKKVVFCGVDEVTEIAFLSLQETDLKLAGIIDNSSTGKVFFGEAVRALEDVESMGYDLIVITSFQNGAMLRKRLIDLGVDDKNICDISAGGWIRRIEG